MNDILVRLLLHEEQALSALWQRLLVTLPRAAPMCGVQAALFPGKTPAPSNLGSTTVTSGLFKLIALRPRGTRAGGIGNQLRWVLDVVFGKNISVSAMTDFPADSPTPQAGLPNDLAL